MSTFFHEKNDDQIIITPQPSTDIQEELKDTPNTEQKWTLYKNDEYGFEINIPSGYEVRTFVKNEATTSGCIKGEEVDFYFYKKWNAPERLPTSAIGNYAFSGFLKTPDFKELNYSTQDKSFCGPVFNTNQLSRIYLKGSFNLAASALFVPHPTDWIGCSIYQTASIKIDTSYKKYSTFALNQYVWDLDLSSAKLWETECTQIFNQHLEEFRSQIEQFDLIAKSVRFYK